MISTIVSSTSDYYSIDSEYDYQDFHDVVKAAPFTYSSTKEIITTLHTLLQHEHLQPLTNLSSKIKLHHSITLLKLAKQYHLSDEIFIRANALLHQFLLSTCSTQMTDSLLLGCLSLSTKLSQHFNMSFFDDESMIMNENMICNGVDWDIDVITPVHFVEAILLHMNTCAMKDQIRKLSYELIVMCLIDVDCMDVSMSSLGMGCLLVICEVLNCCEILPREMFDSFEDKTESLQTSLTYIRQVLLTNLCQ